MGRDTTHRSVIVYVQCDRAVSSTEEKLTKCKLGICNCKPLSVNAWALVA